MDLSEKMKKWEDLQVEAQAIEKEIIAEVLALGKSQTVGRVTASYRKSSGNGSYNYESMVMELEPDQEIVDKHTEVVTTVKWKDIAEEVGVTPELKEKYYTPAKKSEPKVTVSLE